MPEPGLRILREHQRDVVVDPLPGAGADELIARELEPGLTRRPEQRRPPLLATAAAQK